MMGDSKRTFHQNKLFLLQMTESENVKIYTDKHDPQLHIIEVLKAEAMHAGEWTVEAANQVGKEVMTAKVSIKSKFSSYHIKDSTLGYQVFSLEGVGRGRDDIQAVPF